MLHGNGNGHEDLCFVTTHSERECAQRGDPDPDRLKVIVSAVLALTGGQPERAKHLSGEFSRKWNAGNWTHFHDAGTITCAATARVVNLL